MVYHALNRSNFRSRLFKKEGHYQDFLALLGESLDFVPMRLLAYCLMPNHWHLVLYPRADGDLSKFLPRITFLPPLSSLSAEIEGRTMDDIRGERRARLLRVVIGIDRRVRLGLCSLAAIVFPIWLVAGGPQSLPESRQLVATPALRAEYLKGMLDALCTQIGVRVAGSPGDQKGALLIEREMRRALPVVHLDTFRFRRWEPVGGAELEVNGHALETYIYGNSPGTPPDGVGGILMKSATSQDAYEVVDGPSGTVKARIHVSEFAGSDSV